MAKLNADDLSIINDFLSELGVGWEGVRKAGLWEGAAVFRDGLEKSIDAIPTTSANTYYFSQTKLPLSALRPAEKQGLKDGLVINHFERTGDGVSVTIGFGGYNSLGKPNALVARSYAKGSTIQKPTRFVARSFGENESKRLKAVKDKILSIKIK